MLSIIVQSVKSQKQLERFQNYLRSSLSPGYLEKEWSYEGYEGAEHAFRILQSDLYPQKDKSIANRWREFANFLFIYAMEIERKHRIKMPLHAAELGEYTIVYLDALGDPDYERKMLFKTLIPEYHDPFKTFNNKNVAARKYLPKS